MIVFLILFILILLLIFDIFRYNKVKANAFSEYELKKAASEEAKKLEYSDPFITCEYCGAKIDTHKDKCCSCCGAPYDLNEEWKERHSVKDSFIKDGTDAVNEKREKKALVWSNEILKRIRLEIIIIAGITVSILGMSILGYYIYDYHRYRRNEDVNKTSNQNYVKADYQIIGDGVIYDKDGIKITITGIYENTDLALNDKKLLYENEDLDIFGMYDNDKYFNGLKLFIVNKSNKDYTLDDYELRADGVNLKSGKYQNGLIPSGYIYESELIRSYDIEPEELYGKKMEIAVSFSDKKEHLHDFSTGFMDVSELYK